MVGNKIMEEDKVQLLCSKKFAFYAVCNEVILVGFSLFSCSSY